MWVCSHEQDDVLYIKLFNCFLARHCSSRNGHISLFVGCSQLLMQNERSLKLLAGIEKFVQTFKIPTEWLCDIYA